MIIPRSLFSAALVAAFSVALVAQQAPSGYHRVACIKVKPGQESEYHKWAAEDLHKVAQARADSGAVSTWFLLRAEIPEGASAECDYLSISMYPGVPTEPMGRDDLSAVLKKAGLTTTAQEFVDRRNSLVKLISNNLFQNVAFVGSMKKGDYFIVNYMKVADTQDWLAYEKKIWQPMAELMAKDGARSGWSVNMQVLPNGSDLKYQAVTVDVYPSWNAIFEDPHYAEVFKKAHPDMEIGTTMEHFDKLRTILSTNLYQVADMVSAAK